MSRLRLIETGKFHRYWDRDSLRLRLIETENFYRCRDSSRLRNFINVETKIYRDWEILWLSKPRLIDTGQKMSRPRLYRESRWSLSCPMITLSFKVSWECREYWVGSSLALTGKKKSSRIEGKEGQKPWKEGTLQDWLIKYCLQVFPF